MFFTVALEFLEHSFRNLISSTRPDINDLVVPFAIRNDSLTVLAFDFIYVRNLAANLAALMSSSSIMAL